MSRPLPAFALLLLLCLAPPAQADCGFAMGAEGMTIVVGKNASACLAGAGFRAAFATEIRAATVVQPGNGRRLPDDGKARPVRLSALGDMREPQGEPGGRYYGQR
ncbi:MAG TPA: hypothetical protein VM406_07865 [Noviherbaspirillum sp.]|nr:hypothetical protein [Noviherbaspirillum sp.]